MKKLVALFRSPRYSPAQHGVNDAAILDVTLEHMVRHGWHVDRATERDVEAGQMPAGDLYLNMCQGPEASQRLLGVNGGALVVNHASAVLNCHRHRLVDALRGSGLSFPATLMVSTVPDEVSKIPLDQLGENAQPIWVKRGDVHAERAEDVVAVDRAGVPGALAAFAARGIGRAALQAHVPGPVIKFYAVAGGGFFRWYPTNRQEPVEVDVDRMRELALAAARTLGLEIFGGDVAVPAADRPVLIDINDWPSFASFREEAGAAIAAHVNDKAQNGGMA